MHKQQGHKLVFNGTKFVHRIVAHNKAHTLVTVAIPGEEIETAPIVVKKEDKKAERARIAAELFKTL